MSSTSSFSAKRLVKRIGILGLTLLLCASGALTADACLDTTNVAVGTTFNGDICSSSAFTSGANSIINGNVHAVAAVTLGANSRVTGSVVSDIGTINYGSGSTTNAVTTVAHVSNMHVLCAVGNAAPGCMPCPPGSWSYAGATSCTSCPYGFSAPSASVSPDACYPVARSAASHTAALHVTAANCVDITNIIAGTTFNGDICSNAAFTSGADSIINGNVVAHAGITTGAGSIVYGSIYAGADIVLGANSRVTGGATSATGVIGYGSGATVQSKIKQRFSNRR